MSRVINKLQSIDSLDSLSSFILESMSELHDLYNSGWDSICADKDAIYDFILFKHSLIAKLDFDEQANRAFIMICLDFAERLNFQPAIPHLMRIAEKHSDKIHLSKRLTAGISYIYPRPHTGEEIVGKYSSICSLLQDAIDTEEDNNKKCLVTFLSYYSAAADQLSEEYINELKSRIDISLTQSEYPFLNDIEGLNSIDVSDPNNAQLQIQAVIDSIILDSVTKSRPEPTDDFIIEEGTEYSRELQSTRCSFQSIKRLSDNRASGNSIRGRGVQQIQSEDGLFDYMRNYGNMHQAKIKSALASPFPQTFDSRLSLIDWGCGQGLASMVFMDKYGIDNIKQIILIEPSEMALRRAALHCKKYAPNVPLQTICKDFDELTAEDIYLIQPETTIHLFSNVLDMESYSVEHLADIAKSFTNNEQFFVCVSPFIDDIKTEKIDTFVHLIQRGNSKFQMLSRKTNTKNNEFWNCNNMETGRSAHHGESQYCRGGNGEACESRWTRIVRVFQI